MRESIRRGHIPASGRSPSISAIFCARARSASHTWRTIRASRTPTACVACRRSMARSAARSIIARKFWKSNPRPRLITRSSLRKPAALLNEAKVLAHPASIDNLPTSGGKEDHVSMGMTSALKLRTIVENAEHLFAIELLTAAEGLEFRRPLKGGVGVEQAYERVRKISPAVEADRSMSPDIARVAAAIRDGVFDDEELK